MGLMLQLILSCMIALIILLHSMPRHNGKMINGSLDEIARISGILTIPEMER